MNESKLTYHYIREDPVESCITLARLIDKEKGDDKRKLLFYDYASKFTEISYEYNDMEQLFNVISAVPNEYMTPQTIKMLGKGVKEQTLDEKWKRGRPSQKIDVAFITIKPNEWKAVRKILNIVPEDVPKYLKNGIRYFEKVIINEKDRELNIIATMVGKSRKGPIMNVTKELLANFDISLCVLVGMACGRKGKVKLGDVVCPDLIIDIEGGKETSKGTSHKGLPFNLDPSLARDIAFFSEDPGDWKKDLNCCLADFENIINQKEIERAKYDLIYEGTLLSNEKKRSDNKMENLAEDYDYKTVALDMEASGFAEACGKDTSWIVFRGIADFCEPETEGNKMWQTPATLAAMAVALYFVKGENSIFCAQEF